MFYVKQLRKGGYSLLSLYCNKNKEQYAILSKTTTNKGPIFSRVKLYWLSQLIGWSLYVALLIILNQLEGFPISIKFILNLVTTFLLGILATHLYRELIIRRNWLRLKIIELIPRLIGASFVFSSFYIIIHRIVSDLIIDDFGIDFIFLELLQSALSVWVVFMFWSLFYFLFHFIQNYRKEEIKNLRWQAIRNEIELNKIKSQLNPHFIFNSMNIIRALVEEDPKVAKDSITRLSNILRSSMLMGRKRVIKFSEELQLVHDYLNLEKTRFEERLSLAFEIDDACLDHDIPPMILQTLVENGIKHGVSHLPDGGAVKVSAKLDGSDLCIEILNSGIYHTDPNKEIGFGLINTQQRLQLLYGKEAMFSIENTTDNQVLAKIRIPEKTIKKSIENESISH